VIVHAELLPIFILGVPPEVGLEVDDIDGIEANVNEVDESRNGDLEKRLVRMIRRTTKNVTTSTTLYIEIFCSTDWVNKY